MFAAMVVGAVMWAAFVVFILACQEFTQELTPEPWVPVQPTLVYNWVTDEPVPLTVADEVVNRAVNSVRDRIEADARAAMMFGVPATQTNAIAEEPRPNNTLTVENIRNAVEAMRAVQGPALPEAFVTSTDGAPNATFTMPDGIPGQCHTVHNRGGNNLMIERGAQPPYYLAPDAYVEFFCARGGEWTMRTEHVAAYGCAAPQRDQRAIDRSISLLRSWLNPEQLRQFENGRSFEVVGNRTGRRYRVRYANAPYNVDQLFGGERRLCFVPADPNIWAPGDVMLAQKLALEFDEDEALRVANREPFLFRYCAPDHEQEFHIASRCEPDWR